jgi:hypothetical protein
VDCPGLVFPSFANSKAEMYCCGVLPIQNIREYLSPVSLIISRVPKEVLEKQYKIKLPPRESIKYTTTNFLSMFALQKGWITGGSSNPNIAEAAKVVIKDYTTGALVFCHVRPDFDKEKHQAILQSGFGVKQDETIQSSAQDYTSMQEESTPSASTAPEVITDKAGLVGDGVDQIRTGVGAGIHEEDLDKQFFSKHLSQEQYKKLKLNKGEKRALKFILKRQGMGENIDLTKLTKTGDLGELKQMLALETKKHQDQLPSHKNFIETGTTKKKTGNNSNKQWDYKNLVPDDSD